METGKLVMIVVVIILLIVALYYSYKFLYGAGQGGDEFVIYQSSSDGLKANPPASSTSNVFTGAAVVPYIYPGGEYSISTWIYVRNWDATGNKPFLILSNGPQATSEFMTLVMYLGKATNKLGIRMSYGTETGTGPGRKQELNWNLLNNNGALFKAEGQYADSDNGSMDIDSIDIQRWVNITTVISGTTVDVYLDGKLTRSAVLPQAFTVDGGETPTITLGHPKGFNGIIGKTRASNLAYSPDKVYNIYQEGPFSSFNLLTLLNPFQYGLIVTSNNSTLVSINQ